MKEFGPWDHFIQWPYAKPGATLMRLPGELLSMSYRRGRNSWQNYGPKFQIRESITYLKHTSQRYGYLDPKSTYNNGLKTFKEGPNRLFLLHTFGSSCHNIRSSSHSTQFFNALSAGGRMC